MGREKRELWVADSETDPFRHGRFPDPFIWGATNGEEYCEFKTTLEFVDFIAQKRCLCYAHNGGKFDWHFLLDLLDPFTKLRVISGRVSQFQLGEAELRDSYDIIPRPLADWQKDDFDYSILERDQRGVGDNPARISKYLRSDCFNLYGMVGQFHADYGRSLTLSGAALKYWQRLDPNTPAPSSTGLHYSTLAPYYFGGRTELFRPGIIEKGFELVDLNSAYPGAMMQDHPYGELREISRALPSSMAEVQRSFITLRAKSTGAFPVRDPKTGGLSWPNDGVMRRFDVTGWEYVMAADLGLLQQSTVICCLTMVGKVNFKTYVEHFYALKQHAKATGADGDYLFAKLFLNTLYGKLAANPDKYNDHILVPPRHIEVAGERDGYGFCSEIGPHALLSRPICEAQKRFQNVGTAASITGYVRAQLMRGLFLCRGVIYCDTDSIYARDISSLRDDIGPGIGLWDHEDTALGGAFAGKKLYTVDLVGGKTKTASKGVRLSGAEIRRVAEGDTVSYKSEAPSFSLTRGWHFIERDITMLGKTANAGRVVDMGDVDNMDAMNYDEDS